MFSNVKQITALFGHSLLYSLLYISPCLDHALGPHQARHHGAAEEDHDEGLGQAQHHRELHQEEGGGVTQPVGGPEGGVAGAVEGVAEQGEGGGEEGDQGHRDQAQLYQLIQGYETGYSIIIPDIVLPDTRAAGTTRRPAA